MVRPKVVLLGMLTKMPVGGVAWLVAQYALGMERLGCDVYYVEAHARTPSMFVRDEQDDGTDAAAGYLDTFLTRLGLGDRWALHALHADGRCVGMSRTRLDRLYREAALILNMHGGTVPLPEHAATGRLALLGTDPVELELEIERGDARALEFLDAHSVYFTWGLNHGNPDCELPWDERYPFVTTPPPVVLDLWANGAAPEDRPFTTIGNWRQHWREVRRDGEVYSWSKHHEFLKILDLPARVATPLELALSSYDDDDRRLLEQHGWRVRPGLEVSSTLDAYRDYVIGSRGELTVAKDQNVRFRTGWFSERSAAYLAASRPVVMQDTGFANALPTGDGLLPFTDLATATAAVESVLADGKRHRRAARDIARSYLSHDVVLGSLLDHAGIPTPLVRTGAVPFPPGLRLTPLSRRPLRLDEETEALALRRPVRSVAPPGGPPVATIVVAVLDNLAVSRLALESVLEHTSTPSYELVVVDNGSAPPTRQYLSVLAARHRHVRVLRNPVNRGFAAAANQGLAIGRGEIVVLLNNDTIVTPGWLDRLCAHLDDESIGIVGPVTNRCGNEAEVPNDYETYGELLAFAGEVHDRVGEVFDLHVATMFCTALRREVVATVGLLDERFELGLFEDDDYSRRVRDAGFRVVCAPDVFVHHFGEASLGWVAAAGRYGELFDANRRRFEEKWGEPWTGHGRRPDPDYEALVGRVRVAVERATEPGAVVAVVSRGDEALVSFLDREGRHFPCLADGTYAGHHPADGDEAVSQLEAARDAGARYLVVPATARWWLEHYGEWARHLATHHRRLVDESDTAVVYALEDP